MGRTTSNRRETNPAHELPVTGNILAIVLRHTEEAKAVKVVSVRLGIGESSNISDLRRQRHLDQPSGGAPTGGATLKTERLPVVFRRIEMTAG
ncbi:MAG: hypothetical protein QM278_08195 [Pseudomonadota bacterium]|nr:hypothetical protein [Pseudomonadota bacterium]